jgi:anti-sigma factor (TIGR02949 family)
MRCNDVERVVYFFLDGALDPKRCADFSSHIHICPDCEARTIVHRRILVFLKRRLTPMSAPARLKLRLSRALRAFAE